MKDGQTHTLKQVRNPVVAQTANTIHISHVALQQTQISGHVVMQASDLPTLKPEMGQNIVRGFTKISVASTELGVNDLICLLCPYVTLNPVG